MKKKEKESLASIVAEMLYRFNSTHDLQYYGVRLLCKFPDIDEYVSDNRYKIALHNINHYISEYLRTKADPNLTSCKVSSIVYSVEDTMYEIIKMYIESQGNFKEKLLELEDKLRSVLSGKMSEVRLLIKSQKWIEVVSKFFQYGSNEYLFLTGKYKAEELIL